jgi:HEAT repeat protein
MRAHCPENYEHDPTPSREAVQRFRAAFGDDANEASLWLVHCRGGEEELALGVEYSASEDALDRATGAQILGQLGCADKTFHAESVRILISLLEDPDEFVVCCAGVALGHRRAASAIPALLKLAHHTSADIRYGVVAGLLCQEDPAAVAAMITLSSDEDRDVRNWATFGIGNMIDVDSPEVRDALRQRLADPDHEIRGEGLVGLAKRGDSGIVPALLAEWEEHESISILSLEAAEQTRDPRLHDRLKRFAETLLLEGDRSFARCLRDAIAACDPTQR